MAILMNNVMNNELRGYAEFKALRSAVVGKLYERSIVIRKFVLEVDDNTREENLTVKLGTIGMNPVAEAFGLDYDVVKNNVPVEVNLPEVDDKTECRRIKIDGHKYIQCTSLITLECQDDQKIEEFAAEGFIYDGILYRALAASPSNEKKAVKFFYRVTGTEFDVEDSEVKAFKVLDKVAGCVFSAQFVKKLNGKKITKMNTRLGNYLTTMLSLAQIDLSKDYIAIVREEKDENGKVTKDGSIVGAHDFDGATRAEMKKKGIKIDNHINDGANYYAVEVVQEIAANAGIKLSKKGALKVAVQNRATYLTGKTMSRTLTKEQLVQIAEANNAEYFGNRDGRLLAVFDEDGAKLINYDALNKGAVIDVYVMALAKPSTVRTSGQHLIKYMAVDPEATVKFLKKAFAKNIDNMFLRSINGEGTTIDTVNAYLISMLGQDAMNTTSLVETQINELMTKMRSSIGKLRIDIDGIYSHMMFDLSYALTDGRVKNVLGITNDGFVEAYSEDICRMYKDEIAAIEDNDELTKEEKDAQLFNLLSGVVIKYPSAMPKEYEIIVYLTKKQIEERIKAIANNNDRKTLREYFNNTPYGCTVYAPINAMKNKLAGADVDFDATMCDMSELKFILIDQRRKGAEGFVGDCTYISYDRIENRPSLSSLADECDEL